MKLLVLSTCAALIAGVAAAQSVDGSRVEVSANGALLNISVEGRSTARPDLATFNAGVLTQGRTAGEAMSANTARMSAMVATLKKNGVAERDIQTAALTLQPQYVYPQPPRPIRQSDGTVVTASPEPQVPRIAGYEARNTVTVRVRRIEAMGPIIDTLVAAGANQVDGPYFTLDAPDLASDAARAAAMRSARHRADLYAREAGFRRARLVSVTEGGGYYPTPQQIVLTSGQGYGAGAPAPPPPPPPPAPVQSGDLAVGVTLSAQFILEP